MRLKLSEQDVRIIALEVIGGALQEMEVYFQDEFGTDPKWMVFKEIVFKRLDTEILLGKIKEEE